MTDSKDRLAVGLLVVAGVALVGMLLASWSIVLYAGLILVGLLLAMAMARRSAAIKIVLPVGLTAILVLLYGILHAGGVDSPSGTATVLGFDPLTAFYFLVIGPVLVLVGLLYAMTVGRDEA